MEAYTRSNTCIGVILYGEYELIGSKDKDKIINKNKLRKKLFLMLCQEVQIK